MTRYSACVPMLECVRDFDERGLPPALVGSDRRARVYHPSSKSATPSRAYILRDMTLAGLGIVP
ncbi:MAG: hypothetical protein ACLTDR_04500 [Adlercreutzia equolifaciens]